MTGLKLQKGCVYFFKHKGLPFINIGFYTNESPINRFEQFKTYAPTGAEIVGFINVHDACKLEAELHNQFSSKRLNGEWFDISIETCHSLIALHTSKSDDDERSLFYLEYAKYMNGEYENVRKIINSNRPDPKTIFLSKYKSNKNINISEYSKKIGVSRQSIYRWIDNDAKK